MLSVNKKKSLYIFSFVLVLLFSLTGCTSKEAKKVIEDIDALGEITLDSYSTLQNVNEEYDSLSEKDKESVKNKDVLEAANEKYAILTYEDLDHRIENSCVDVTSDDLPKLKDLLSEYENLEESGKEYITNIEILNNAISDSEGLKAEEVKYEILESANGGLSNARSLLQEYADIMDDGQIEECLVEIGRWDAVGQAEEYLKTYLKDPGSYVLYSGACSKPSLEEDNRYKLTVSLDYGASNSFNAMVRDKIELYVYFTVNTDGRSVDFVETSLTEYYKWKYS